jgi:hypothetical protein
MATNTGKPEGIAAETGSAGQRDSSLELGAPPSNTAPHNCNWTDDVVLLRSGVDTLQLSYKGKLNEASAIRLRELKRIAQSESKGEQAYAQWSLGGELFSVLSRGSGRMPYTLMNPSYRLSLSDGKGSMPLAFIQIQSGVLTKLGPESAIRTVSSIVNKIAFVKEGPGISRIDICLDFSTRFDMESIRRHEWVTRAKRISQYVENNAFTGWTIGLRGAVACRLYDKTAEILVSDKPYMRELWLEQGWDGVTPVWRLEFEVKREAIRQFDVESMDIKSLSAGLWAYLTQSWLRLAVPSDSDTTRSRWETHPLWKSLEGIAFGALDVPSLQRVQTTSLPSYSWIFRSAGSGIITFMAVEGINDFAEGCRQYGIAYLNHMEQYSDFRGSTAEEFVTEKIRFLRRKYNLAINERPDYQHDPVAMAIARHYAKGKDGE